MPGYKYNNIKTATTTVVKNRSGILKNITVNTTAAGAVTVYDNASAGSGATIATFPSAAVVGSYEYDARFINGLTIVTAAASDITVTFE